MNKIILYLSVICLQLLISINKAKAQEDVVKKIELKVVPFFMAYALYDYKKDLEKIAPLTITIKYSELSDFSNDDFFEILKSNQKLIEVTTPEYRVKCTIYLFSGKSKILYMNVFGEFLYEGKTYKNERIKEFVFEHIPNAYKDVELD